MAAALMASTTSPTLSNTNPNAVHLPSMSITGSQPFLQPSNGNVTSPPMGTGMQLRRGPMTDPEMHAHASGLSDAGSRPGSSQAGEAMFGNSGQKRKTSDPDWVPEEEEGREPSAEQVAKRRSSAFSTTANRLDSLNLNQRRSSTSSAYSTSSSAGWSPANNAYAYQQTHPQFGFNPAAYPSQPGVYPSDPAAAQRSNAPLAEQLANYGFPPPQGAALTQNPSAIGPITNRRGSVPMLNARNSIVSTTSSGGSDPRRVFAKDDDEGEPEGARSRNASVDEGTTTGTTSTGQSPYSRSPELRVSHKLAERKRRKEMTQLFDELRDAVPSERGNRSSKWETLVKAIDFITNLKEQNEELQRDNELMRQHIGIPGRASGSLPFLGNMQSGSGLAPPPGPIQLPQQGDQPYVYGAPYGMSGPPGWPNGPAGGGQQTPRAGPSYMGSGSSATTQPSAPGS